MQAPSPRPYSVADFFEWHNKGQLVLQPKFQRREVWEAKAQSYLIDTIVRGLPVPVLFIRSGVDLPAKRSIREVVDGQQRLTAVLGYLDGKFELLRSHNKELGGRKFQELPDEVQKRFLSYEFAVVVLTGATDKDVLDIFARVNSYALPLNDQELLNAEFYGEFKRAMYDLAHTHFEFWRGNGIFSDRQIARMMEVELTSELTIAMLDGLQDKKKSIRKFYKDFDDNFPAAEKVVREFQATVDKIAEVFEGSLVQSAFSRRSLFYTLFCVLYDALHGLPKSPSNPQGKRYKIPSRSHAEILAALNRLDLQLSLEKPDASYVPFVTAISRQTDNIRPRETRHKFVWDAIRPFLGT